MYSPWVGLLLMPFPLSPPPSTIMQEKTHTNVAHLKKDIVYPEEEEKYLKSLVRLWPAKAMTLDKLREACGLMVVNREGGKCMDGWMDGQEDEG